MKYSRIKKFQQGGGLVSFTPIVNTGPSQPAPAQAAKEAEEEGLISEDVYKKLLDSGGLVNDVNLFVEHMANIHQSDPLSFTKSDTSSQAIRMIGKINELRQNKAYWTDSLETAKKSGGLNEMAIGSSGELYVRGEGGIKAISMSEYKKNKDKYNLMSVADMLNARQYDPSLSFDKSIFTIANQSKGLEQITDHIKGMLSTLSEATTTTERHYSKEQIKTQLGHALGKKPSDAEVESLRLLSELEATPGDFYKVELTDKTKRNHIDKALNYIWSTLDKNAQMKLEASSIYNENESGKKLILDVLIANTEPTNISKITPETELTVKGRKPSADDIEDDNLTNFQMFNKDKLMGLYDDFKFNDPKVDAVLKGTVGSIGALVDRDNHQINMTTIGDIVKNRDYGMVVNQNQVHFGNKKLDTHELNQVIYDGRDVAKIYMPVGTDGMPDYESNKKFKELYSIYESNKDVWTTEQAERHFAEGNFHIQIEEKFDGGQKVKVIKDNAWVKPFLVMYGYTNDATNLTDDNGDLTTKLTKNEKNEILPILEGIWTYGTGKNKVNTTPDDAWGEDYYKGIVTIPYRPGHAAQVDAMIGQGPRDYVSSIEDVQRNIYNSRQPIVTNVSGYNLK